MRQVEISEEGGFACEMTKVRREGDGDRQRRSAGKEGGGEFDEMLSQPVGPYTMLAAPCGEATVTKGQAGSKDARPRRRCAADDDGEEGGVSDVTDLRLL